MDRLLVNGSEHDGVSVNDRKFETWRLQGREVVEGQVRNMEYKVQVYTVPRNGYRGAEADGFKIVIKHVVVTSRDLDDLRRKAINVIQSTTEEDHEKVLVIKTTNDAWDSANRTSFGIDWQIGWRVAKLDVVFNFARSYILDVENYDEPFEPEKIGDIIIGSKAQKRGPQKIKTAVIPWTQEREDILKQTVQSIMAMHDKLNERLKDANSFATLLDAHAGALLLGTEKHDKSE